MTTPTQPKFPASCADCHKWISNFREDAVFIGEDSSMAFSLSLASSPWLCRRCAAAAGFAPNAGRDGQPAWLSQTTRCQLCGQAFPRTWHYNANCNECQSALDYRRALREQQHQGIHQQEQGICPSNQPGERYARPCPVVHQIYEKEFNPSAIQPLPA